MRGLVIGGMLAATMLPGMAGAQDGADGVDAATAQYMAGTLMLAKMVTETMTDLGQETQDVLDRPGDAAELAEVYAETGVLEAVYEAALELEPPAMFEDSHEAMMDAFRLYAESAPLTREGLLEMDPVALAEGAELVTEASERIQAATALLPSIEDLR